MKRPLSIPNELFEGAECLARPTRKSRSRLFSGARANLLRGTAPDKITESMDQALAEIGETNDPFVSFASARRLEQSEW